VVHQQGGGGAGDGDSGVEAGDEGGVIEPKRTRRWGINRSSCLVVEDHRLRE